MEIICKNATAVHQKWGISKSRFFLSQLRDQHTFTF
jgi:hypothetical protein